jgi:hypothetical protein
VAPVRDAPKEGGPVSLYPDPYRTELGGTEIVALSADAFERLDGCIGAQAGRVRALQRYLIILAS